MKIVFWGTPNYAVKSLTHLIEHGHEIVGVVTQPDRRRNRGKSLTQSPVKVEAAKYNIPVFTPIRIKEDIDIQNKIFDLKADVFIVVAFGQILPKNVLDHPPYGSWNSHGSILPRWRGAAPIQWSLIKGDKSTGICIMHMEEGLDTGAILIKEQLNIDINDNHEKLSSKLSILSANLLEKSLEILESNGPVKTGERNNKLSLSIQSNHRNKVSYARLIKKSDYIIDWNNNSLDIHRKVMGLYPNAYSYWKSKRIKILATKLYNPDSVNHDLEPKRHLDKNKEPLLPGTIIRISKSSELLVMTTDYPLVVVEAQIEGKKQSKGITLIQQLNPKELDRFI